MHGLVVVLHCLHAGSTRACEIQATDICRVQRERGHLQEELSAIANWMF